MIDSQMGMDLPAYSHSFGSSDRCGLCDVRWHSRNKYPCIKERQLMDQIEPKPVRTHHKNNEILSKFEDTRSTHGGVIADAAKCVGVSEAALQRALYRAKQGGWEGHFTTSHKKAKFTEPGMIVDVSQTRVEHYHEQPLPPRANALYGAGEAS